MNLDLYRMQKIYVEIYYWVGRVYEYFGFESNIVGEPARTGITIYRTTINYQLSIALNPILPVTVSYHVVGV